MRALTVLPGVANSLRLDEVPEPPLSEGSVLARAIVLGVCGTDREIMAGKYGAAPPGQERLILGHESLGRVEQAPRTSGFAPGDLIVGFVRHPDPVPCPACAAGEWDMCLNGQYTEHGIKARNGFGAELFRIEPEFAIKIDPDLEILGVLIEPTSVVAKVWDHIDAVGRRSRSWPPKTVLVTGAGPIGLLAALIGVQRGLEVHLLDRNATGPKPELARGLGAKYHTSDIGGLDLQPDILIECTGALPVITGALQRVAPSGIVCLAGVTPAGHVAEIDVGAWSRAMVLGNQVVFGSVNGNRQHYEAAAQALANADKAWLRRLITRRVPLERWQDALEHRRGDIKNIIDIAA
ncbi:MAG TPA: glucose 1-dehydrogenase [Xanthobacteraceae bacterium]|nr:glucose 1-dehydrogenase [Xanthobacteraceae bacterium]